MSLYEGIDLGSSGAASSTKAHAWQPPNMRLSIQRPPKLISSSSSMSTASSSKMKPPSSFIPRSLASTPSSTTTKSSSSIKTETTVTKPGKPSSSVISSSSLSSSSSSSPSFSSSSAAFYLPSKELDDEMGGKDKEKEKELAKEREKEKERDRDKRKSSSSEDQIGWTVPNEYIPSRPNDYDEFKTEREQKRIEKEMQREVEEQERRARREMEKLERQNAALTASKKDVLSVSSGEEAYQRRLRMSQGITGSSFSSEPNNNDTNPSVAKRQKRDRDMCVSLSPTKVLLLQNMVGKGQVDADLHTETAEECRNFGNVIKCIVHELKGQDVQDDEAVRIFVHFTTTESAKKAMLSMNGRFFGGRQVKAMFANEERFERKEYEP
eukprot:TRINITY_DN2629_c0_g1_i1.p1 TRINITY_DN2629_c0_g1~~TRINITY_DN2629_c0_g1_i1.p1  ORF type:complete len:381 (+),score=116.31 TRINITY_DN2629_c0_g1_i1:102-1244(+)